MLWALLEAKIKMKIKDVPAAPAYLAFHDAFDHGAMDVYAYESLEAAERIAKTRNEHLGEMGQDDAGFWRAYTKLPRVRIYKFHGISNA